MNDNLEAQYRDLSIEDGDKEGIVVGGDELLNTSQSFQFSIVSKILTNKSINFNAMKNTLASFWQPV